MTTATASPRVNPPLKWFGGKHYLAPKIIALMPKHRHYVEPYFGGGSVLLARDPDDPNLSIDGKGVSEVANDINPSLAKFWWVLRDTTLFEQFRRRVEAMPMARTAWEQARDYEPDGLDPVGEAVAFFILCRQSLSGRMNSFTAITRSRTRRNMNGNVSEWLSAVDGLPAVHARLRRVLIENKPALDLIRSEDTPETLFYLDPPYLHETRTSTDVYAHEMSRDDHISLLEEIQSCKGRVMLSGYCSDVYDFALRNWNRHTFDLPNNAAGGKEKRRMTEVLWTNF